MDLKDYIQLGIMSMTFLGVLAAFVTLIVQLINNRKQSRLMIFVEYTRRYQEIMLNLPSNISSDLYDLENDKDQENSLRYIRAYFDLCSEEYYLFRNCDIEEQEWKNYRDGLKGSLMKKSFQHVWSKMDKDLYEDFSDLVKEIVEELEESKLRKIKNKHLFSDVDIRIKGKDDFVKDVKYETVYH